MISCYRVVGESFTTPPPLEKSGSRLSSELLNSCKSPKQAWVYSFHLWGVSTLMAVINWLGAGGEDSFVNWGQVSESCYPGWPPHLGRLWGHLPPIIRAAEPIDTAWLPPLVGEQSRAFTGWSAEMNTMRLFDQAWPRQLLRQRGFEWTCFYLERVCFDWIWRKAWGGSLFGKQTNYILLCCLVVGSRICPQQYFMERIFFPVGREMPL